MKKNIWSIIFFIAMLGSCTPGADSGLKGIIGTDDSVEVPFVPAYSVSVIQKISEEKTAYCNGVKLQDGKFFTALHCLKAHTPGSPVVTSAGLVEESVREKEADLFIGTMIGGVAPSEGARIFHGEPPLAADLEAHWFDPLTRKWKLSKGHAKRSSTEDLIWRHDLDFNPGASGAGLFLVTENGDRLLVGIHLGFAKNENIGLVLTTNSEYHKTNLASYMPEGICVGFPVTKDGKTYYEWSCPDGEEGGGDGGTGDDATEHGPETPNPTEGEGPTLPEDSSDGDDETTGNVPSETGDVPDPWGIDFGGGPTGSGTTPGEGTGGRPGSSGSQGAGPLSDGQPCHACQLYRSEMDKQSLFKPGCDQESGWTNMFGQQTPSGDHISLKGLKLSQTQLTEALRSLAEKVVSEKKWKSPDDLQTKISQLSQETVRRLQNWLNKVIKSADDYYALVITSNSNVKKPSEPVFNETAEGIEEARRYLDHLKKQIAANPDQFTDKRYSLLDASQQLLKVADIEWKNGDPEKAQIALEMSLATADATLSATPIVGWGKDIYEAWTGYSLTSGRRLTTIERSLAIGGAVSVGIAGAVGASAKVLVSGTVIFKDAAKLTKQRKS
ncbi:MAG TPA: pre-toxin TG domain-containing protein [Oligoflexus sp.]|uniref:pre-toxin TG domain-containing protein n=1 Tax=Oligoflexus sp. TaxID=1971216 RepID=UPI002D6029B0|nr:pre-toxin TG domain-containing protein [Oligoflexus sp.]HYX39693.1 pre-toxin TG domain-containing protein [Oligoflexus sp.]